jgi:hypothetical protein
MSKHTGLGTMQFGGALRPFHVDSMRQTEMFCITLGIGLEEYASFMAKINIGDFYTNKKTNIIFTWSALYAGAMRVNRHCDFTYDDVIDWYEDAEKEGEQAAVEFTKPVLMLWEMNEEKMAAFEKQKKSILENANEQEKEMLRKAGLTIE